MLTHKLNTKTYMSVKDIGELLGISKAAVEKIAYTKNCFNTERLCGKRWVELESFEKWYANQTRYKKITGAEPGDALREWSYSVHELAQHLFVRDTTIYYLIRKYQLKTVTIDGRIRILKDSFQEWYEKQNRYRMAADREKPACLEENTFSISQIALLLGISRYRVECIAKSPDYSGFFEFVQTGKGRRITAKSFKAFLEGQDKYHLCSDSPFEIILSDNCSCDNPPTKIEVPDPTGNDDPKYQDFQYITLAEAAKMAGISRQAVTKQARKGCFSIVNLGRFVRISRSEFCHWLSAYRNG